MNSESAHFFSTELEKLRLRQRQAYEQTNDLLDKLITILNQTKESLHTTTPMQIDAGAPAEAAAAALPPPSTIPPPQPILGPMMTQIQALQVPQKLSNEQKEMNAAVARVIKAIERGYPCEIPEFLFEHPPLDKTFLLQVPLCESWGEKNTSSTNHQTDYSSSSSEDRSHGSGSRVCLGSPA